VERIPARPVASIRWVKMVSPRVGGGGRVPVVTFEENKEGKRGSVGDAGGESGQGGGACVHETEIGRPGSEEEKHIESTFVCS
jgi:hypothetical protein